MTRPVVFAIIPVGTLVGAKSRLGGVLDAEERLDLVTDLARRTIAAAVHSPGIAETIVVTPDDDVRGLALAAGARPLKQRSEGLNRGLREARDEAVAAGAEALLILPIDLPAVSPETLKPMLATLEDDDASRGSMTDRRRPLVALVADRHGRGTNALLVTPPDAIDFCFGRDSRRAHVAAAEAAGARFVELDGPLSLDLDTADDLLLVDAGDAAPPHGIARG